MQKIIDNFIKRFPELQSIEGSLKEVVQVIIKAFKNNKTLFLCGNGGSAADCEHIAGELLKSFVLKREANGDLKKKLKKISPEGGDIGNKLEEGFKAITLTSHPSFSTAFANDVDGSMVFAQQLFALAEKNDVVLGISTSGNAENIKKCFILAKAQGIKTILLTGIGGGLCAEFADYSIKVPESETFLIQEKHVGIYHALCLAIEDYFYGSK